MPKELENRYERCSKCAHYGWFGLKALTPHKCPPKFYVQIASNLFQGEGEVFAETAEAAAKEVVRDYDANCREYEIAYGQAEIWAIVVDGSCADSTQEIIGGLGQLSLESEKRELRRQLKDLQTSWHEFIVEGSVEVAYSTSKVTDPAL